MARFRHGIIILDEDKITKAYGYAIYGYAIYGYYVVKIIEPYILGTILFVPKHIQRAIKWNDMNMVPCFQLGDIIYRYINNNNIVWIYENRLFSLTSDLTHDIKLGISQ